jgi:hypothetical protein
MITRAPYVLQTKARGTGEEARTEGESPGCGCPESWSPLGVFGSAPIDVSVIGR